MMDSSFRGLLRDLGIFFGTVLAFVGGFLLVSYVIAPSRNPYGFWLGFLLYMYAFTRALRWAIDRRKIHNNTARRKR